MTTTIETTELKSKIDRGETFALVEALPEGSYRSGHLPGALNIPMNGFGPRASELVPELGTEIVVYCAGPTCENSRIAGRKLEQMGYQRVRVFTGGKFAWKDAGFGLEVSS
jgi:rhodanese-related sulfurtransferase